MARLYSIQEFSKLLGRHHATVRRLVAEGLVPYERDGHGHLIFNQASIRAGRRALQVRAKRMLGCHMGNSLRDKD